ncbi:AraC family transcriptional regulator [Aestuariivirga litoralis]|uniref:AraC family transcriptional regulator n=1 Tax=Aestuariivirga litoralis TaxID=2650924 RepID=A0A2W2ASB2_9HYPH|nr:helix-turn-helix domain-containing protein [Aestuariivirga litoralis]PZF75380.1 AraC family transcriptional regulator [Aestuariivirga litoralis]
MPKLTQRQVNYRDESVPAHPELDRGHPVVVFGDHSFCAGSTLEVRPMPRPHMHSQVELNFVLDGAMTYWFDGRVMELTAGRLALFWGMIPHQVTDCAPGTRFVVLYVPMATFLELPALSELRSAIFRGAVIEALDVKPYDRDIFQQWRGDLLAGDGQLEQIVKSELSARVQRLDREGWRDLRETARQNPQAGHLGHDHDRALKVEKMAQFIGEHALEDIAADDVARAAGLHPNYAMSLFKRGVGLTIKQSITRHRLDMAQSMLIATDLSVAAIAFDCGFNSLSSFYTAFTQRFRQSPAAFREAYERITKAA